MNILRLSFFVAISIILVQQCYSKYINTQCTGKSANIIFVMDTSSSIWIVDYKKQIKFAQKLVENFHIGQSNSHVRVGAITFSNRAHLEFSLDKFDKTDDLKSALGAIPYRRGQTNTADALKLLMKEVKPKLKVYTAPFIAIVITDGKSRDPRATRKAAKLLHDAGVNVYTIGVGKQFDRKELDVIASDPVNNVLLVANYSALEKIAKYFGIKTCKALTTLPPPPTTTTTTTPTTTRVSTRVPVKVTSSAPLPTPVMTSQTTREEMLPQRDQSSTVSFGYDVITLGMYRADLIRRFIATMLPHTIYGSYRTFSVVDCASQTFSYPFTSLINKTKDELKDLIKPVKPGLVNIVKHMKSGLKSSGELSHPNSLYKKQLAVLFIDPLLTVLSPELISEIENLKEMGTKVLLINIGDALWRNGGQLHSLSSQPYNYYINTIPSYDQLLQTAYHSPCTFRPICNH
ncbi:uncharacterized protein LOC115210474 [Argonauta hians]